jgi:hypothetical protein
MSADKQPSPEHGALEEHFKAFAWCAWKKARRKVLAIAPTLKGLSQHERRLLRRAALQDPVDAMDIGGSPEVIAEELASTALGGAMDPVSKVARLTVGELFPPERARSRSCHVLTRYVC